MKFQINSIIIQTSLNTLNTYPFFLVLNDLKLNKQQSCYKCKRIQKIYAIY